MSRSPYKLSLPTTLSFVVVAAATFAGPWVACGGDTSGSGGGGSTTTSTSDTATICIEGPDAGPKTMCPSGEIKPGTECPPGCMTEVI